MNFIINSLLNPVILQAITSILENSKDIAIAILQTLGMTFLSCLLAYSIGLPLGIVLNITSKKGIAPCRWLNIILSLIVNILRSIPCLIIVVLMLPINRLIFDKGTGAWYTILIPLVVTSFGYIARIVEQSLSEVDKGKIEAVKSLGGTKFQIIMKVLLPEARASLISGLAVTLVSIIGYTSFATNIGAGGIIALIWKFYENNTYNFYEKPIFWIMIIFVVIIVQIIQEVGLIISKKLDKRKIN